MAKNTTRHYYSLHIPLVNATAYNTGPPLNSSTMYACIETVTGGIQAKYHNKWNKKNHLINTQCTSIIRNECVLFHCFQPTNYFLFSFNSLSHLFISVFFLAAAKEQQINGKEEEEEVCQCKIKFNNNIETKSWIINSINRISRCDRLIHTKLPFIWIGSFCSC